MLKKLRALIKAQWRGEYSPMASYFGGFFVVLWLALLSWLVGWAIDHNTFPHVVGIVLGSVYVIVLFILFPLVAAVWLGGAIRSALRRLMARQNIGRSILVLILAVPGLGSVIAAYVRVVMSTGHYLYIGLFG